MTEKRSLISYENYRQAMDKFDYFVVGASGALCAFIAQGLKPERLGWNSYTYELAALALLFIAVVLGFKRLEAQVTMHALNTEQLHASEARGSSAKALGQGGLNISESGELLSPQELLARVEKYGALLEAIEPAMERQIKRGLRYYKWRNRFLALGFIVLVSARVAGPYQNWTSANSSITPRFQLAHGERDVLRIDTATGKTWHWDAFSGEFYDVTPK